MFKSRTLAALCAVLCLSVSPATAQSDEPMGPLTLQESQDDCRLSSRDVGPEIFGDSGQSVRFVALNFSRSMTQAEVRAAMDAESLRPGTCGELTVVRLSMQTLTNMPIVALGPDGQEEQIAAALVRDGSRNVIIEIPGEGTWREGVIFLAFRRLTI